MNVPGPMAGANVTKRSYAEFKQAVFDKQVANKRRKAATSYPSSVPDHELALVEGKFRMRTAAAESCRDMLAAVREALEEAKQAGDALAHTVKAIGIQSAYRNYAEDLRAWESAYATHYADTEVEREAKPSGAHGPEALRVLVERMQKFKAAPGFSNHSNGSAVDFNTTQHGVTYAAKSKQRPGWRHTWLHGWLVQHAAEYRFKPLATEEWHWDYE